jgi:hypothetical protein
VNEAPTPRPDGEAPPLPLSWGQLYAIVILALAASIAALAWLTERWK